MVRSLVEPSQNSRGAVLRHCPAGLDADLAEYLAREHNFQCLTAPTILRMTGRNVVTRPLARTSLTKVIWTPFTSTNTTTIGCAVLEASVGGHIAGFTTAMVIV